MTGAQENYQLCQNRKQTGRFTRGKRGRSGRDQQIPYRTLQKPAQ